MVGRCGVGSWPGCLELAFSWESWCSLSLAGHTALGQSPPPLGDMSRGSCSCLLICGLITVGKKTVGSFQCFIPWPGIRVLNQ